MIKTIFCNYFMKKCVAYPPESFLFKKNIIGILDDSKLIKTKIIIKKYDMFFKNHQINQSDQNNSQKCVKEPKFRIKATRQNLLNKPLNQENISIIQKTLTSRKRTGRYTGKRGIDLWNLVSRPSWTDHCEHV
jgi:hypothetical protein